MNQPLTQQRIRIRFGKHGALRFVGHLDTARTWERTLRRAQIPLEYSQGFNPRPRMQFAAAVPVGVTSESEYLDVWLTRRLGESSFDEWVERLNAASPAGLISYEIVEVPIKGEALPTLVTSADYTITLVDDAIEPDDLRERAMGLMIAESLERVRNGKTYDLRPLILDLAVDGEGWLVARLVAGEHGNGRPDELLDALGYEPAQARIHRRHLYLRDETIK